MQQPKKLEEIVALWPGISVHTHRFGGREFRLGNAEVGHVHECGIVDIPFPRGIRDELLAQGLVEEHRWVPDSGWATFFVRSEKDLQHAVWLMRLSYFRYALKTATDPQGVFAAASQELQLSAPIDALLGQFVPAAKHEAAAS